MTLRKEVNEALENAWDNEDDDSILTRDPTEVAMDMLEKTTFTDVNPDSSTEAYDDWVKMIAMYVKDWQTETTDQ